MCSSARSTFAWLGAILVNIGFISLISWGAVTLWQVGFVLCGVYTSLLFWLAQNAEGEGYETLSSSENDEVNAVEGEEFPHPIIPNLLYALAIIGLGVTGFFLPINLFQCHGDYYDDRPTWKTDLMLLPQDVRNWASSQQSASWKDVNFAYVASTHTTMFRGTGTSDDSIEVIWTFQDGEVPLEHADLRSPNSFTTVNSDTVCFVLGFDDRGVVCSDGMSFRYPSTKPMHGVYDLFAFNGTLWFKQNPYDDNANGYKVYSMQPDKSMNMTSYSHLEAGKTPGQNECSSQRQTRLVALGSLFTTALPVLLLSMAIWWKKHVPSMGMMTYIGAYLVYLSLHASIRPSARDDLFKWWNAIVGAIWLLVLAYLLLTREWTWLKWGLHTSGLAFLIGMSALLLVEGGSDSFGHWVVLNLLCFIPLLFLGAATDSIFLLFLGAGGFFMDAWRLSGFVSDHVGHQFSFLVVFLVLALSGILIGIGGIQLSNYQGAIREWTKSCLKSCASHFEASCSIETDSSEDAQE